MGGMLIRGWESLCLCPISPRAALQGELLEARAGNYCLLCPTGAELAGLVKLDLLAVSGHLSTSSVSFLRSSHLVVNLAFSSPLPSSSPLLSLRYKSAQLPGYWP